MPLRRPAEPPARVGRGGSPSPTPMPPGATGCGACDEVAAGPPQAGRCKEAGPSPTGLLPPGAGEAPPLWLATAAGTAAPGAAGSLLWAASGGCAALVGAAEGADAWPAGPLRAETLSEPAVAAIPVALPGCGGCMASASACWMSGRLADSAAMTLLDWLLFAAACPAALAPVSTGCPSNEDGSSANTFWPRQS